MQTQQYLDVVPFSIISGIIIYSLGFYLSKLFSPRISRSYPDLTKLDQTDWNTRPLNIFYASYITILITYSICISDLYSEKVYVDPPIILRTSNLTDHIMGHSLGFFIVDSFFVAVHGIGGRLMLVHHAAAVTCVLLGIYCRQVHYYIMLMLATEITTPFIQARWLMAKSDMKTSPLYIFNGLTIFVLWIIGRLLLFPYFYWSIYNHWYQMGVVHPACRMLVVGVPTLLFVLNIFWFTKIFAGVYKILFQKKKEA
eukprot:TRINITY_DN6048_c0_g1_i4.p2 TRINITY_DN6048_c0_g1~~TRINITY_DN6048_c0_g1_i4.p2  ORF type:complete len:255 (-),score=9.21 TRINITY_DN6048_c0_g1_i4:931-1695(-)